MIKIFRYLIFLNLILAISITIYNFFQPKDNFIYIGNQNSLANVLSSSLNKDINILILGKSGLGYIGGENTDTIMLLHLENNKIFLISIPRDLLVEVNGYLIKINSLFYDDKELLFQKIEELTGLKIDGYLVIDLHLIKKVIDFIGGVDIYIKEPIVDAASLFTLKPGYYHLTSEWTEFFLRSRYAPDGDFSRIRHHHQFILALRNKIEALPKKDLIGLFALIQKEKSHWETNLNLIDLYKLWSIIKDIKEIHSIILDLKTKFFESGYFETKQGFVYGILVKKDISYNIIQNWLYNKIKNEEDY